MGYVFVALIGGWIGFFVASLIAVNKEETTAHGEWKCHEFNGYEYARCTCCNTDFSITGEQTFEDYLFYENYCPHCGAKMDGDSE